MKTHRFTDLVRPRLLGAASLCSFGALLPACIEAEPRDLGFTQSSDDVSVAEPREPFASSSNEFLGRWVGGAEEPLALTEDGVTTSYAFPSGSRRIALELGPGVGGYLTGRIVFGEGEPPAPPVDAAAGYPVGVGYSSLLGYDLTRSDGLTENQPDIDRSTLPPFEGFEYMVDMTGSLTLDESGYLVPDGVAQLAFSMFEPLAPWCELQTPYQSPDGLYSCAPNTGGQYESFSDGSGASCEVWGDTSHCEELLPTDLITCEDCDFTEFDACFEAAELQRVNCDHLFMCRESFCQCTETSCTSARYTGNLLKVRRVGDELIGVFENTKFKNARGLNVPLGEVRLRLQP
jgi:hypothetical protein